MSGDPFPKVVENRAGERLTVQNAREQDAATAKGYFRSIALKREFAEAGSPSMLESSLLSTKDVD